MNINKFLKLRLLSTHIEPPFTNFWIRHCGLSRRRFAMNHSQYFCYLFTCWVSFGKKNCNFHIILAHTYTFAYLLIAFACVEEMLAVYTFTVMIVNEQGFCFVLCCSSHGDCTCKRIDYTINRGNFIL